MSIAHRHSRATRYPVVDGGIANLDPVSFDPLVEVSNRQPLIGERPIDQIGKALVWFGLDALFGLVWFCPLCHASKITQSCDTC